MTSLKQNCNEQVKAGEGASHSCCHGDERGRGEFGDHTCKQVLTWNQGSLERVKLRLKAFEASLRDGGGEGAQNRNYILAVLKKN